MGIGNHLIVTREPLHSEISTKFGRPQEHVIGEIGRLGRSTFCSVQLVSRQPQRALGLSDGNCKHLNSPR